jgi:hypothetical protein
MNLGKRRIREIPLQIDQGKAFGLLLQLGSHFLRKLIPHRSIWKNEKSKGSDYPHRESPQLKAKIMTHYQQSALFR